MLRSVGRRQVLSAPNLSIGCRRAPGPEAKQRLKGRGRRPPTVVPERELVQVDLELRSTDTMVSADKPLLKIADRTIRQRHDGVGSLAELAAQRLRSRDMIEPSDRQPGDCFRPSV